MLLLQRGDLLDLDAGAEFDLVAGDGRAAGAAGDGGVDLELVEHRRDRPRSSGRWRRCGASADHRRPAAPATAACTGPRRRGRATGVLLGVAAFLRRAAVGSARGPSARRRRAGSCPSACRRVPGVPGHGRRLAVARRRAGRRSSRRRSRRARPSAVVRRRRRRRSTRRRRVASAGAEHRAHGVGHLADGGAGQQQQAEQRADDQQRRGDPRRQAVGQRAADGEADEARGALTAAGIRRRTRPQMPQAEHGQRDHGRAEDQPRPRLGVGFGAHQQHGDHGEQRPAAARPRRPTTVAQRPSRSSRRPAGRRRTRNWRRRRRRRPAAPARCRRGGGRGSMSRARPTERAVEPAPLATISQAARAARPTGRRGRRDRRGACASWPGLAARAGRGCARLRARAGL